MQMEVTQRLQLLQSSPLALQWPLFGPCPLVPVPHRSHREKMDTSHPCCMSPAGKRYMELCSWAWNPLDPLDLFLPCLWLCHPLYLCLWPFRPHPLDVWEVVWGLLWMVVQLRLSH